MTAASGLRHCDLNDLSSRTAVESKSNRRRTCDRCINCQFNWFD